MPLPPFQSIRRLALIGLAAPCGCQHAPTIKGGFMGGLSGRVCALPQACRRQLVPIGPTANPGPLSGMDDCPGPGFPEVAAALHAPRPNAVLRVCGTVNASIIPQQLFLVLSS